MRIPPPESAISALHRKQMRISRRLRQLLTRRGDFSDVVPCEPSLFLDPELRRLTRGSHIALFTLACFLILPALAVFFGLTVGLEYGFGSLTMQDFVLLVAAVLSSSLGVLAWAALGLLLTKPAYPRWHATAWGLVVAFSIVALPSSLLWICCAPGGSFAGTILVPVFAIASASLAYGWRNLRLTRESLRRLRRLAMTMAA
jgi:hypothetical protein